MVRTIKFFIVRWSSYTIYQLFSNTYGLSLGSVTLMNKKINIEYINQLTLFRDKYTQF